MKEYIIFFGTKYMRFFIGRNGLCVSKMEHGRFSEYEILVPEAKSDFAAASLGGLIHIVCQSEKGNILYITYDGKVWEKAVLLKGKEAKVYPKYFTLLPISNFMNLFYIINHDGKTMLIHQILDGTYLPPEVVDYINPVGVRFFAAPNISSDITLGYKNVKGVCGTKLYRWSHKSFMQFLPLVKNEEMYPPFIRITPDRMQCVAPMKEEKDFSLIFLEKKETGEITQKLIAENCGEDACPIIFPYREKIFIQWQYKGSVMSSFSADGGESFAEPVKYVKNTSAETKLYVIDNSRDITYCYGYGGENSVSFYSAPDILNEKTVSKKERIKIADAGYEAAEFAEKAGFRRSNGWEDDPYVTQNELKREIEKLLKAVDGYKKIIDELNKKIELSEENDV